jgi:hypothetical protein
VPAAQRQTELLQTALLLGSCPAAAVNLFCIFIENFSIDEHTGLEQEMSNQL